MLRRDRRGGARERRLRKRARRYRHRFSRDRSGTGEGCPRNDRRMRSIAVPDIRHVDVVDDVIDRQIGDIGDVRHVDVADVVDARRVGRSVFLVGREREPADRLVAVMPIVRMPATTADEDDQGRRVDWTLDDHRPRHPAPAIADIGPAAVMERREAPGRIVDPRPAPRCNPAPMPIAIRRPIDRNRLRIPDRAITRLLAPATGGVEVLISGCFRRDVARCYRLGRTERARWIPVVERRRCRLLDRIGGPLGPRDAGALACASVPAWML